MSNQKKINVLVLESIFHAGGIEALAYSILKRFDKERFNVVLCTLYQPGPMGEPFMKDGYPFYHDLIKNKYDISAFFKLRKIIRERNIDVIYLVTQPLTLFWGFIAAKLCRVSVVCLIGNTVDMSEHIKLNIYKLILPYVDKVVAQANMQKRHWVEHVGIPERLVSVIYNGISEEQFNIEVDRDEKLRSLGIDPSKKVVGIVGRMVELKGVDIFLRAAKRVISTGAQVHFLVVGGGPELTALKTLAGELGINDSVAILGFRDDLHELVPVFDLAIISSRTEAFPMVMLEYMACAKPVVATRVGSIPEIMTDGVTGLLIDPDDPKILAEKIGFLLNNSKYADKLGCEGQKMINNKFRIESTVKKTEELFEELVSNRQ